MNAIVPAEMMGVFVLTFFTLSGLNYTMQHGIFLFALTLLCYTIVWIVNVVFIVTIINDQRLHEAMYIFLCNLCIYELYGTAGSYPKIPH